MKGETIIDYIGMTGKDKRGTPYKIIEWTKANNLVIEFQDEFHYQTKTTMQNFRRGQIKNPYDKIIANTGYIGVGKHTSRISHNGAVRREYKIWSEMLRRCYSEKLQIKQPAYIGCTVCDEWHNYQNFADWYDKNYYDIGEGRMHLDKDIIHKGNRVYSPDSCLFVPQRINMIFMHKGKESDLPTGISETATGYMASYNTRYLGTYKILDEALKYYMIEKRIHIKNVADEYKDKIPTKLYQALINW